MTIIDKRATISIIGGGASGVLTAANIIRHTTVPVNINLIEKRPHIAGGVAYSTTNAAHLLNVPAGRMGAFPDDVGHFFQWLTANGYDHDDHAFVPRMIFGRYLKSELESAAAERAAIARLNIVSSEAVDAADGLVRLADGGELSADLTVLAFGNFLPPDPYVENDDYTASPKYFRDQWSPDLASIKETDDVLIIGTGLSMVDLVMGYHQAGHKGKILAISTRGMLSAVHELGHTYPAFYDELRSMTRITDMLRAVRQHIARAQDNGSDWRAVIDSLRPYTHQLWKQLPLAEKRYFMQHLSRYWNVARHRMPAEAAEVVEKMQRDGRLSILKGRLKKIESGERFVTTYAVDGEIKSVVSDCVINCIGAESNFEKVDSPLLKNLFSRGTIVSDDLKMGIKADENGGVIGADGRASNSIFTLGTALKGSLWESTAIPEIRNQAAALGRYLCERAASPK